MINTICIPINEAQYAEVLRFLDAKGVKRSAVQVIQQFIDYGIANAEWKIDLFFPELEIETDMSDELFVWKHPGYHNAITLPNGTQAKMEYPSGTDNFATIADGCIIFNGKTFKSFSRLANHIANGTSRSAPRDFFIKRPGETSWQQALKLFEAANNHVN